MFLNLLKSRSGRLASAAGLAGAAAFTYASTSSFNRNIAEAESKKVKLTYFDIPGRAVSFWFEMCLIMYLG